ncbi:MAG: 16S rRNA (guanine(527)-N(7))-methyltransferase RsmG [Bacteroidota bacterium]|uniref:16S rRNA (guanine(527)-N(7))-methyltransferase RsmG n=1 Tax=Leeuwenhoekiella TaxID=283735 RepID=UPI000E8CC81E|nr:MULTISPECIES: 16S rRNA (guanine(527)-N(7))-methyltransferase RsmG [Leeuwenhoekiella]MEC7784195.1 16S rRNA (guanine(527)-N(7))-methyltransferase RsmG [Bacteroidota bacterium]HAX15637.1 16S rRNA (guanine(527)-N(7))-methyltransferase RsmG [Leeuwenhoekiella sp.]MEE3147698.1 16S rRNA (guanine(527)-N(7))-methyltransferase RsmG [Bacteroidota bacterium]MEE3245283.1 16S rRNA (guanine(527)-N(7))-methyltransferase RsmG [Bacteroidota bacterium]UBZ09575.1 16S rRNA (guanine(527)-N(7))-methyltransferase R|tara:strand:- start:318 stop:947 length:630 start_codon:yes stop_codon:yes gene_type:complete
MELIKHYFSDLDENQLIQFEKLNELYQDWNLKINVVSRKDIDEIYLRHVLHSLGIAKVQAFKPGAQILDVGTGGGFPGIPLAILFPETQFHLVDSIGKKIKVVEEVAAGLNLKNVKITNDRVENISGEYDFIVSRAVAQMETFVRWIKGRIAKKSEHQLKNGILYLKGGDLTEELQLYKSAKIYDLSDYFKEDFFETKKVVHLPLKYKG